MRGQETDHVISGPIRDLKKTASNGADRQTQTQTDGHRNSMTDPAQRAESVKMLYTEDHLTFLLHRRIQKQNKSQIFQEEEEKEQL